MSEDFRAAIYALEGALPLSISESRAPRSSVKPHMENFILFWAWVSWESPCWTAASFGGSQLDVQRARCDSHIPREIAKKSPKAHRELLLQ